MNIIYATDAHLKSKNPSRRLDNYQEEILDILSELGHAAKQHKAKAVLFGGDLFDTPKISQRLYNKVAHILSNYPCRIYAIAGNHDIFGMNTDTLSDTMLGGLFSSGLITLLDKQSSPQVLLDLKLDISVAIYGHPYHSELDKGDIYSDYSLQNKDPFSNYHVLMTHSMLLEKPFHPDVHYTLIDDVAKITNADIIFGAHYHPGWGVIKKNNTTFIHPGAIARLEATKEEISRLPSFVLLNFTSSNFTVKLLPFKSAKPGNQVLNIASLISEKEKYNKLESFRENIISNDNLYTNNIYDTLISIADTSNIETLIKDVALEKVSEIQSSIEKDVMLAGFIENLNPKKIASVHIKNFQSHIDTKINFGDGLNAIIGPSDSGKTATIRAIRWCLYNEPKGADFINRSATDCSVTIYFTDGTSLSRSRTHSSSGEYVVSTDEKTYQTYKGFSNNVPIDIYNLHQMPKIHLTKDNDVSLNISTQLEPPFLITESIYTKAAIIGKLTGVHVLDSAIKDVSKDLFNNQREVKSLSKRLDDLTSKLNNDFNDIPILDSTVSKLEKILTSINKDNNTLHSLQSIYTDYIDVGNKISDIDKEHLEVVSFIDENKLLIHSIEKQFIEYSNLLEVHNQISNNKALITSIDNQLTTLNLFNVDLFNELLEDFNLFKDLVHLQSTITDSNTSIDLLEHQLNELQDELNEYYKEYNDLISSIDYCPLCNSKINYQHTH